MSLSSALYSAFLLHFCTKQVGGNSRTTLSASIFSPSCDLDWNTVREQVIPSLQLWGLSVARGASVFCRFSSRSTAEKENGSNRAFQSPIYRSLHLSAEEFYRNYAYGCVAGRDAQAEAPTKPRAQLSTETRQLSLCNTSTQSSPDPALNWSLVAKASPDFHALKSPRLPPDHSSQVLVPSPSILFLERFSWEMPKCFLFDAFASRCS